jgi:hypothetical protein
MADTPLSPLGAEEITALFTRADGQFLFARWGRPLAPVVFGVEDASVPIMKGAIEAVVALAGHAIVETDPELGANLMVFFIRDWSELTATPGLDRLLPDLADIVARLEGADANQYRAFRFDADGGIKAAFVFVRMDAALSEIPGGNDRAEPGRADDPFVVRHGLFGNLAACRRVRGWPRAAKAADRRPDPRGL